MKSGSSTSITSLLARAALAGFATGLRSVTPLGVMARNHGDPAIRAGWKTWPVMNTNIGRIALQLGWLGELIGDKLPFTPSRTQPSALAGRLVLGALAGLAIGTTGTDASLKPTTVLAGLVGAAAGSFGGYHYRSFLSGKLGLPDLPGALLEDAAAFTLARKAIKG